MLDALAQGDRSHSVAWRLVSLSTRYAVEWFAPPPGRLKPWTSPGEASPWSDPPWPATDPPRLCWRVCAARLERAARFVAGPSKQPMQLRRARLALEHLRLHPECLRSEEHTSELQSQSNLVCRLLLEKKKNEKYRMI